MNYKYLNIKDQYNLANFEMDNILFHTFFLYKYLIYPNLFIKKIVHLEMAVISNYRRYLFISQMRPIKSTN